MLPVRFYLFILALLLPASLLAQMSAPGMSAVRYTTYTTKDPVFIFCNSSGSVTGNLNAVRPGGSGIYSFSWYSWNSNTAAFSDSITTQTGVTSSSLSNIPEGGYKVNISKGAIYDTSLIAWVFIDKPYSLAKLKNRTCNYVALDGTAAIDTFYYKDPSTGVSIKLPNKVTFLWSSNPTTTIPYPDFYIDPKTFDPPLFDLTYNLQVTDSFGCSSSSSFFYESIHVKAEFTADPVSGGAPLEVSFTNTSTRGYLFSWNFGDPDTKDDTSSLETPEPYTYYIPDEYTVTLIVESEQHCIDSMVYKYIVVDPSDLDVPNVFSPNGDGYNDVFKINATSLRFFSLEIFTRSGKKVYSFSGEGEKLSDWEGWDGTINNTSLKAQPGIYFYIIKAYGYDNVVYTGSSYRGALYIYR